MGLFNRTQRHYDISSQLAHYSDSQLVTLLKSDQDKTSGWGNHKVIEVKKQQVFVKRLPLSKLEKRETFSTRNHFELPVYYNYGVGSAGKSVWRELLSHIKTSNWVLSGVHENFPLLHHYRVLPRTSPRKKIQPEQLQKYVAYWNNNKQVETLSVERAKARYELVLFIEYFPYTLARWLHDKQVFACKYFSACQSTLDFLKAQKMIHFDAHFHNVVTNGEQIMFTDFGLLMDKAFELDDSEKMLFKTHRQYDYAQIILEMATQHFSVFHHLSPRQREVLIESLAKYGVDKSLGEKRCREIILNNLPQMEADGVFNVSQEQLAFNRKFADVVTLADHFFNDIRQDKLTKFKHKTLKGYLTALFPKAS